MESTTIIYILLGLIITVGGYFITRISKKLKILSFDTKKGIFFFRVSSVTTNQLQITNIHDGNNQLIEAGPWDLKSKSAKSKILGSIPVISRFDINGRTVTIESTTECGELAKIPNDPQSPAYRVIRYVNNVVIIMED